MIHIAFIEDNLNNQKEFDRYLEHYKEQNQLVCSISYFEDGETFLKSFRQNLYDLIFIDIILPGISGMDLARKIREMDDKTLLVFATNAPQYAVQGYSVNAQDYLLKPVSEFDFQQLLKRCLVHIADREEKYLLFTLSDGVKRVRISQITYIESLRHKITVHTDQEDFLISETMKELEQRLTPYYFFRCNNGYLVNLKRVTGFRDGFAELGPIRLVVSRPRKKAFMEALTSYIGEVET